MKRNKGKKLDIYDRMTIQACISKKMTIKEIATRLNVHISTIYRELERNSIKRESPILCYKLNSKYKICNNCHNKNICNKNKRYYDFEEAEIKTKTNRKNSRKHLKLSDTNLKIIDELVKNGVDKGQSIHHIYISNPILHSICCEETIRRLCYKGYLTTKAHELRRFVRFRHKNPDPIKNNTQQKNMAKYDGRTYRDYLDLINSNSRVSIVQFDSVIGKADDRKAILTITLIKQRFQFGILYDRYNSANEVFNKLANLFKSLGFDFSKKIFAVCLSDNGSEFNRFSDLEFVIPGIKTFYTNPYNSSNKAHCERNHEFIRYVIPKSTSFDNLTQDKVDLLFSHINSYVRKSNKDKTPYELVVKRFGKSFVDTINISKVKANAVNLKPSLIK